MLTLPGSMSMRGAVRGTAPLRVRPAPAARVRCVAAHAAVEPPAEPAADAAEPAAPRLPKRRLIVLRHADAEPRGDPEADAGRVLSARGKREARTVARQLGDKSKKWRPHVIFTSDAARTKETVAEMTAAAPKTLAHARVIELPEFYTASGSGADALAALNAALSRHATSEDATALLVGHNPGWEEAVALLTCAPSGGAAAEGSEGSATPSVAPMRTAQAALLRSEQRAWCDALTAGWSRRGDVGPPPRKTKDVSAAESDNKVKHPAEMSDKELLSALAAAEKAAVRSAKASKAPKGEKKKKAYDDDEDNNVEGSEDPSALDKLVTLVNAEPDVADAKLDAWWAAQGSAASDAGDTPNKRNKKQKQKRDARAPEAAAAAADADADASEAEKVQEAAAAAKREAKAAAKAAAAAAAAEAKAAAAEAKAAAKAAAEAAAAEDKRAVAEEKAARRSAQEALAAERAAAAQAQADEKAAAKAAKAAAREAAREAELDLEREAAIARATAEMGGLTLSADDVAALEAETERGAVMAVKVKGSKGSAKKGQHRSPGPEQLFAAKSAAKAAKKSAPVSKPAKALKPAAEEAPTEEGIAARARREAAEAAAAAAWALETMRAGVVPQE